MRFTFDFDALFRLNGLVKTVAPASPGHEPTGVLINNHYLVILDDIIDIFFVDSEGTNQLVYGVDSFVADGVIVLNASALLHQRFGVEVLSPIELRHQRNHIG